MKIVFTKYKAHLSKDFYIGSGAVHLILHNLINKLFFAALSVVKSKLKISIIASLGYNLLRRCFPQHNEHDYIFTM